MTDHETEDRKSNLAQVNLGRDLLKALVDVIRTAQKPWHSLTESEQTQLLDRLRDETDEMVRKAINTLLTGEFAAVPAKLHQVVVQDGIKANLQIDGNAMHRHELVDASQKRVLLVIADPGEYLQSMDQVKADADQPDMFEPAGEAQPLELPPMGDGGDDPEPESTPAIDTLPDDDNAIVEPPDEVVEGEDGLPEGLEEPTSRPEPPPVADPPPAEPTDPDPQEDKPPPANNEATLVEPHALREKLGKIQIDVPEAIIDGWQASERLTALRFANAFWEAVQLEDQPPQPPFFLLPYTPNG